MRDMAAVDPRTRQLRRASLRRAATRPLEPRIENGVKVFDLEASVIRWNILPDVTVDAYAFNGQVPGPRLQRDAKATASASTSATSLPRRRPSTGTA